MRTKYEQDSFAVFQGTIFSATTNNGYVELLTTDRKLAKKFNFLLDGDIYYKDITPYDVTVLSSKIGYKISRYSSLFA